MSTVLSSVKHICSNPVKSPFNTQLPLFSESVIHHNSSISRSSITYQVNKKRVSVPYGVSSASKLLPVSLFRKKYDYIKRCLCDTLGLPDCQVEGIMRLLRVQAYYGVAYPKAAQIGIDFQETPAYPFVPYPGYVPPKRHYWGTSRASFWRAVRRLKELGLITVVNRYILRPHAQISNLYRLDKLLLLIARYLAEHGVPFFEKWLMPYLQLPWPALWGILAPCPQSRAAPFG